MTANILVKESCPRPVQMQRHITKVAYMDLAARKLNLLNLQLYVCACVYIYIYMCVCVCVCVCVCIHTQQGKRYIYIYIYIYLLLCFLWSMGFVVHVNQVFLPLILHIPLL